MSVIFFLHSVSYLALSYDAFSSRLKNPQNNNKKTPSNLYEKAQLSVSAPCLPQRQFLIWLWVITADQRVRSIKPLIAVAVVQIHTISFRIGWWWMHWGEISALQWFRAARVRWCGIRCQRKFILFELLIHSGVKAPVVIIFSLIFICKTISTEHSYSTHGMWGS